MQEFFYLKVYLFKPNLIAPIKISQDSQLQITVELMDYTIPAGATASAFARGCFSQKIYTHDCQVSGNKITFVPPPGFFVYGKNLLQYEISNGVIPLAIDVDCRVSLPVSGETAEPETVKPLVQRAEEAARKAIEQAAAALSSQNAAAGSASAAGDSANAAAGSANAANQSAIESSNAANAAGQAAERAGNSANAAEGFAKKAETLVSMAVSRFTVSLPAASWADNQQTVAINGATADEQKTDIVCSPSVADRLIYSRCGVYLEEQLDGAVRFACGTVPDADITINILLFAGV